MSRNLIADFPDLLDGLQNQNEAIGIEAGWHGWDYQQIAPFGERLEIHLLGPLTRVDNSVSEIAG